MATVPANALPENGNIVTATQEIRYVNKEAGQVFFVWGINNWKFPPKNLWPAGSFIKGKLLYTPMIKENEDFSVKLNLKPNTTVDYVFWISKGLKNKTTDVWDNHQPLYKDYHTLVLDKNVAIVESVIKVRPKEALSILDFSWHILITVLVLLLGYLVIRKYFRKKTIVKNNPSVTIMSFAVIEFLVLFFIRPSVLGISWDLYNNPVEFAPQMFWTGLYDLYYVCILTVLFLIILIPLKKYPVMQISVVFLFIALGIFSIVAGLLNIRIVEILGKPFNYQWLYYSDFLRGDESKTAISANISSSYITDLIVLSLAAIIAGMLTISISHILLQKSFVRKIFLYSSGILCVLYLFFSEKVIQFNKLDHDKLANPVWAFLKSANPFSSSPALFTMTVADSLKGFDKNKKNRRNISLAKSSAKIKNVIVFVLESTPAEYIESYGGKYLVTPELQRQSLNSIIFENIYAHAPGTNLSMVSLLSSVYPALTFSSITEKYPDMDMATIPSELKKTGYRTAFFNSADNRFQNAEEFLINRDLDMIKDCRDNNCEKFEFITNYDFMNGKDDDCTAKEMMNWIEKDKTKPFFAVMWTYQTHYPYFFSGVDSVYYAPDRTFNRYLNALHHSDYVLGKLIVDLKSNNLFESTLIVVVGDHGEAFGRHNQTTHACKIYEENLHIPCIFINPAFTSQKYSSLGGLIDIAPTIMNTLGFEAPEKWQGENLLNKNKNSRVYFFAPWSDYLFGYREGDHKFIYNATKDLTEIYDLKNDPEENRNLAPYLPAKKQLCHQRLAAWTQYVNKFMEVTLNAEGRRQYTRSRGRK